MRIYFEHTLELTRFGKPQNLDHDPIYRDWPVVPRVDEHLSFDIGDEGPIEGNVRAVLYSDGQGHGEQPEVTVRFS